MQETLGDLSEKINSIIEKLEIHASQESNFDRMIRWMTSGVKVCIDSEEYIGASNLMLCYLDAMSGYYSGSIQDKHRDTKKELRLFIETYLKNYCKYSKDINGNYYTILAYKNSEDAQLDQQENTLRRKHHLDYIDFLYYKFRNGLAHEFFMKPRNSIYKGLQNKYFMTGDGVELAINIDKFYFDFVNAVMAYSEDFHKDQNLQNHFNQRTIFLYGYKLS